LDVFTDVERGSIVGEAETLDSGTVGGADAEDESAVGGGVNCGGLLREDVGVAGVGGYDAGAKFDFLGLAAGEGESGKDVSLAGLSIPVAIEAAALGLDDVSDLFGDSLAGGECADE